MKLKYFLEIHQIDTIRVNNTLNNVEYSNNLMIGNPF